jgi:hypothetical protein
MHEMCAHSASQSQPGTAAAAVLAPSKSLGPFGYALCGAENWKRGGLWHDRCTCPLPDPRQPLEVAARDV